MAYAQKLPVTAALVTQYKPLETCLTSLTIEKGPISKMLFKIL